MLKSYLNAFPRNESLMEWKGRFEDFYGGKFEESTYGVGEASNP